MVIKASAATEVSALVEALSHGDDIHREAAIARLAVIGSRAVDRLMRAYSESRDRAMQLAVLRVFEAIGDRRTLPIARDAIRGGGDLAVAAAGVLRSLLTSEHAAAATDALDALVSAALDAGNDRRLRLAAIEALHDVPGDARDRVAAALASDPAADLRRAATTMTTESSLTEALWRDALEGHLPDTTAELREAIAVRAGTAPLNALRKLVDAVRERESRARPDAAAWRDVRGALHQALALRGSRVALYDLRESLEAGADPLPASFLAALHVLGDESCLEPLAVRWSAATAATAESQRWRHQLAETFKAIARREKITRRHAVIKRVAARHPDAAALWSS
ncbi:MAG TPA: hypothetical protein VFJ02_05260 [Vicinamibacterales bacterium]|nr:hypothetical protein [Vicinamibacterales bacterium]